jgi:two-component system chemotaxis response regulator CheY
MKRILVVDDAMVMRRIIGDIAKEAGWELAGEACDGDEAVELYARLRPDLVTLDLVMPRMTGLEALRAIRAADPNAQVIVITALDQKQALMDSVHLGAMDFIVKPFDRDRVRQLLGKLGAASSADPTPPSEATRGAT